MHCSLEAVRITDAIQFFSGRTDVPNEANRRLCDGTPYPYGRKTVAYQPSSHHRVAGPVDLKRHESHGGTLPTGQLAFAERATLPRAGRKAPAPAACAGCQRWTKLRRVTIPARRLTSTARALAMMARTRAPGPCQCRHAQRATSRRATAEARPARALEESYRRWATQSGRTSTCCVVVGSAQAAIPWPSVGLAAGSTHCGSCQPWGHDGRSHVSASPPAREGLRRPWPTSSSAAGDACSCRMGVGKAQV